MFPKGFLQQGSLPTKLQATLADPFLRVFLLTSDIMCNGGMEMRWHAACLGTCAVGFPNCKAQERRNVDAGGSLSRDGWADFLHSHTQLMAQGAGHH